MQLEDSFEHSARKHLFSVPQPLHLIVQLKKKHIYMINGSFQIHIYVAMFDIPAFTRRCIAL